jgi:hypothetical protein
LLQAQQDDDKEDAPPQKDSQKLNERLWHILTLGDHTQYPAQQNIGDISNCDNDKYAHGNVTVFNELLRLKSHERPPVKTIRSIAMTSCE